MAKIPTIQIGQIKADSHSQAGHFSVLPPYRLKKNNNGFCREAGKTAFRFFLRRVSTHSIWVAGLAVLQRNSVFIRRVPQLAYHNNKLCISNEALSSIQIYMVKTRLKRKQKWICREAGKTSFIFYSGHVSQKRLSK